MSSNVFAQQKILFLGDSLTEGYNISKEKAYPYLIEKELIKNGKKDIEILNGSISGSTTASGLSRLRWYLKAKPTILVLALGANDGLRGLPQSETKNNLKSIIELALEKKMKILLTSMKLPPNYGVKNSKDFEQIFSDLAKKYNLPLVPFLLEGVAANPLYNLSDGIHPNELGHEIIKENVLKYLRPLL